MKIGISGTRKSELKTYQIKMLNMILNKQIKNKRNIINVGDCPTGIDKFTEIGCHVRKIKYNKYNVVGERTTNKLRNRTIKIVTDSDIMICFISSLKCMSSGTWLAIFESSRQGKKCYVCWKHNNNFYNIPKTKEILNWKKNSTFFMYPVLKEKIQTELFIEGLK